MELPILDALLNHKNKNGLSFHTPGHKNIEIIPEKFYKNILKIDLTELEGLDNLQDPKGIIQKAELLAANVFKADKTYFLVNGSTIGVHAAILGTCKPGQKLIVQRDVHKSVIGAMILAGVEPVFVNPEYNKEFSIASALTVQDIRCKIEANMDCVGVLILNPNYYGIVSNLIEIVQLVHSYNKILIVDEAHGSHLTFSERLPCSAMEAGADICIQSAHKTLPALTQSAYLHFKEERIDQEKIKYYLNILQTTSPSYLLLACLDYARYYMDKYGEKLLANLIENIHNYKHAFHQGKLLFLENENYDNTRLVVNFKEIGMNGFEVQDIIINKYNLWPEMADFNNVVFITTIADNEKTIKELFTVLNKVCLYDKAQKNKFIFEDENEIYNIFENFEYQQVIPLAEMKFKDGLYVDLREAIGKVNFNIITPYPPGIPLINPGELITKEAVDYIIKIINGGGLINGIRHEKNFRIKITLSS